MTETPFLKRESGVLCLIIIKKGLYYEISTEKQYRSGMFFSGGNDARYDIKSGAAFCAGIGKFRRRPERDKDQA